MKTATAHFATRRQPLLPGAALPCAAAGCLHAGSGPAHHDDHGHHDQAATASNSAKRGEVHGLTLSRPDGSKAVSMGEFADRLPLIPGGTSRTAIRPGTIRMQDRCRRHFARRTTDRPSRSGGACEMVARGQ